jgi:hypothetical protein
MCVNAKNREAVVKTMLFYKRNYTRHNSSGGRRGSDCMIVGFTITYAISAYQH